MHFPSGRASKAVNPSSTFSCMHLSPSPSPSRIHAPSHNQKNEGICTVVSPKFREAKVVSIKEVEKKRRWYRQRKKSPKKIPQSLWSLSKENRKFVSSKVGTKVKKKVRHPSSLQKTPAKKVKMIRKLCAKAPFARQNPVYPKKDLKSEELKSHLSKMLKKEVGNLEGSNPSVEICFAALQSCSRCDWSSLLGSH